MPRKTNNKSSENSTEHYTDLLEEIPLMLHRAGGYDDETLSLLKPELNNDKEDYFMELIKGEFENAQATIVNYFSHLEISFDNIDDFVRRDKGGKWRDSWDQSMKQNVQAVYHLKLFNKAMQLRCFYQSLFHGLHFMSFMHGGIAVQQESLLTLGAKVKAGGKHGSRKASRKTTVDNSETKLWWKVKSLLKSEVGLSKRRACEQAAKQWEEETGEKYSWNTIFQNYNEWETRISKLAEMGAYEYQNSAKILFSRYGIDPQDYIK